MKKLFASTAFLVSFSAVYAAAPAVRIAPSSIIISVDDPVDLNQYVGKYKFEGLPFEYLTVAVKDGKLMANTGEEEAELTPLKETDSFDAAGRAILKFRRDPNKKVNAITLDAEGSSFEGRKES
ncbi:DUF3471 domain-containing protein [Adhaeribacter swui]|uniref:DUF3471 domain-containing protein n=1 Tax=Adhaeribacter swui TaxID=2086471 RepID=A0A7G7G8R7_9BACT|nr:DUF3471 domain-containing protein [Adhaeribacter swui]QNF33551.1 DUF3471 domain-containing protein [Adhaeribacter swui]